MGNKNNLLKGLVVLSIFATIFVNYLSTALPLNGFTPGELSDMIPNYIVPAGYVFSIWGVIYTFLIGYGIYQFFVTGKHDKLVNQASPYILLSGLLNCLWLVTWHYRLVGLSVLVMLSLLVTLIIVYNKLKINIVKRDWKEKLFVEKTFSIYLGWISVATVVNIAAFLVVSNWSALGFSGQSWTTIMITVVVALTFLMLRNRKDTAYSLVIIWALIGIGIKQQEEALILGSVITAIGTIITLQIATVYNPKNKLV